MTLAEIQNQVEYLLESNQTQEAADFAQKLEMSLKENNVQERNPEIFKSLSHILFTLYVFAIRYASDEMLERIIKYNSKEALTLEFTPSWNFYKELEGKFLLYPSEVMKEMIQFKCLPILEKSTQYIGQNKLALSIEQGQVEPSILNWFKYYDRKTGLGKTSNFERSRFFSSDETVLSLSADERTQLRAVLAFYDYLRNDKLVTFEEESDTPKKPTVIKTQPIKAAPQQARTVAPPQNISAPQVEPPQKQQSPISMKKSQTIDLKKMMEDKRQ